MAVSTIGARLLLGSLWETSRPNAGKLSLQSHVEVYVGPNMICESPVSQISLQYLLMHKCRSGVNRKALSDNIHIIGEAIARYMYKLPSDVASSEATKVEILRDDLVSS